MPYLSKGSFHQFNRAIVEFIAAIEPDELPSALKSVEETRKGFFTSETRVRLSILISKQNFDFSQCFPHVKNQLLINAISSLCAYQQHRMQRIFGRGELYDSTNLVCEQLKSWLSLLSSRELNAQNDYNEIQRYKKYVNALRVNGVFPAGFLSYDRTMNQTLYAVEVALKSLLDEVNKKIPVQEMHRALTELQVHGVDAFQALAKLLFYVLNSNRVPAEVSLEDLKIGKELSNIARVRSFILLQLLLQAEACQLMLPGEVAELHGSDAGQLPKLIFSAEPAFYLRSNGVIGSSKARSMNAINKAVGGNLIPDRSGRFLIGQSGLQAEFESNDQALQAYRQLFVLAERLALFVLLTKNILSSIDQAPLQVWFQPGLSFLEKFQQCAGHLQAAVCTQLERLFTAANNVFDGIKQAGNGVVWMQNFECAVLLQTEVKKSLEGMRDDRGAFADVAQRLPCQEVMMSDVAKLRPLVLCLNQVSTLFNIEPIATQEAWRNQQCAGLC